MSISTSKTRNDYEVPAWNERQPYLARPEEGGEPHVMFPAWQLGDLLDKHTRQGYLEHYLSDPDLKDPRVTLRPGEPMRGGSAKDARSQNMDPIEEAQRRAARWWQGLLPVQPPTNWDDIQGTALQRKLFASVLVLAGVVLAVLSWSAQGFGVSLVLSLLVLAAGLFLLFASSASSGK